MELSTLSILSVRLEHRKDVFAPAIESGELVFRRILALEELPCLPTNKYGIKEPVGPIFDAQLDLIIVPALAFTQKGERLGRGGAYFEGYLRVRRAKRAVGSCLGVPEIPVDAFCDERVDEVLTEQ
jgi:5-formyltetrahydrofolate cyclo-ligase